MFLFVWIFSLLVKPKILIVYRLRQAETISHQPLLCVCVHVCVCLTSHTEMCRRSTFTNADSDYRSSETDPTVLGPAGWKKVEEQGEGVGLLMLKRLHFASSSLQGRITAPCIAVVPPQNLTVRREIDIDREWEGGREREKLLGLRLLDWLHDLVCLMV